MVKENSIRAYIPKKNRIKTGSLTADIVIYGIILISALITVYPFVYILSNAISEPIEAAAGTVWLLPKGFSLQSFSRVFASGLIVRSFANSVFFTATVTILSGINTMLAGYALSKKGLVFRKFFIVYIIVPMFFSGGLIPYFLIITQLKLYNTLWAIILPGICSIWNIILARTFIRGIPDSLTEAAIIDGANEIQTLFLVIIPLCKPIIAVTSLYVALGMWNSWFNFMLFIPRLADWHPLQLFLAKTLIWGDIASTLQIGETVDPEIIKNKLLLTSVAAQTKYTVIVIASVPIIAVYPFIQKYFVQGALIGSLKE